MTGAGFILREFQGIPYYGCLAFEDLPYLRHGFSTRRGGAPDLQGKLSQSGRNTLGFPRPGERKQNAAFYPPCSLRARP